MASEELLSGATGYVISDSLVGQLNVAEALAWFRSDSYQSPGDSGPVFQVVDQAQNIQEAIIEPDARIVMGDAQLVKAVGGLSL